MQALMNNGNSIPYIGLGTWRSPASVISSVVTDAIDLGYRHFDCAFIYGNETEIGEAIKGKINDGTVKREELFITSKIWNTFHHPDRVRFACELSIRCLKTNYLDLYLIHWPMGYQDGEEPYPKNDAGQIIYSDVDYMDTWREMEALVDDKLCRNIGVSNFNYRQINRILNECRIKPQVLQVECHPYLPQEELIQFCKQNDIVFTAYSPLGSAHTPYAKPGDYPLLENPAVKKIAELHKCTPAQVLLRYQVQRGNVVIPRSVNKEHLELNLNIEEINLSDNDLQYLKALDMGEAGRIVRMDVCHDHPHYPFTKDDDLSLESE